MNKIRITHNDQEYNDLNYLFNLTKLDLEKGLQIDLLDQLASIAIGFSSHHSKIREDTLHVYGVDSGSKGAGKKLLYLITCLAKKLGLSITFEAQPGATDKFSPNTPEEEIKEKEEKLMLYYNKLGFKREGPETYNKNIGLYQHYYTQPNNVLKVAAATRLGMKGAGNLGGNKEYGTYKDGSSIYKDSKGYYYVAVNNAGMYKKYLKGWKPAKNDIPMCFKNKKWGFCKTKTRKQIKSGNPTRKNKDKGRKGPSESATDFPVGTIKVGNNKKKWIVKKVSNGTQRWVPL